MKEYLYDILLIGTEKSQRELELFLNFNNIPKEIRVFHYEITNNLELHSTPKQIMQSCWSISGNLKATTDIIHYMRKNVTTKKFIFYSHHDSFNLTHEAYKSINEFIKDNDLAEVGMIGFNIFHDEIEINRWDRDNPTYQTTARTPFEKGDAYYRCRASSCVRYEKFEKMIPFEIPIPMWSCCLINLNNFQKYISETSHFDFFMSLDDIAVTFLKNNIKNICYPKIAFSHQQTTKKYMGLITKSPNAAGGKKFGRTDWLSKWTEIHGFPWNMRKKVLGFIISHHFFARFGDRVQSLLSKFETVSRAAIKTNKQLTLSDKQRDFYNHDIRNGPVGYFK